MFKTFTLIVLLTFSSKLLAECKPVVPMKAGEKVECDGYLFSPDKELQLRQMNEDYKLLQEQTKLYIQQKELYKQQVETSEKIIEKTEQKVEVWKKQAEDSTQKLITQDERQGIRDWVFLVSGIGLTALAGWAVGASHK